MTASGLTPASKLLDMALDDVDKVMRRDRAIRKNVDGNRPYRTSRDDSRGSRSGRFDRGNRYASSNSWQRPQHRHPPRAPTFIVKVSNLDHKVSKDDLMKLFASVGEVEKVWIDYDHIDRSMGTGGCIFKSEDDAKRAISEHDGSELSGRIIQLSGEYQVTRHHYNRRHNGIGVKAPW
ncbi:hypothetical protein X943_001726 [Babesia divergens]|uniref:RRM domain-containing protein n=1 Tax=Babesia divergens TaxID=32595 RepID=A0AAD9GFE0_BABDI|nr:hypothetical protein X943_001726 [Babesia divergens]